MATQSPRSGVVSSFDDPAGQGVVRSDDGRDYPFHCTSIADGSRTIDVGANVEFSVAPGRLGVWEATGVAPTS